MAETVKRMMPPTVAPAERDHFVQLVLAAFDALHTGNAVRSGIRPLELVVWQSRHGAGK